MRGAVLVTRPQPGAADTAARLAALGYTPMLAPMLTIEPRAADWPEAEAVQAVLVSSANALTGVPAGLHPVPLFAVGAASAARARAMGFARVESADADGAALAALVRARLAPEAGRLLVVHGQGQGDALCAQLEAAGFRLWRVANYAARPVTTLPAAARTAWRDGRIDAVLAFSGETATAFVGAVTRDGMAEAAGRVIACAISQAAAAKLAPLPFAAVRVAARPDQESVLALLT